MRTVKKKSIKGFSTKEAGYNLIQICIAMLVVGVLLSAGASAYNIYKRDRVVTATTQNVAAMTEAINGYRAVYGTYPCPAPLNVSRQDPNYGNPTDCSDTSVAPGNCGGGICVQRSTRTVLGVQ